MKAEGPGTGDAGPASLGIGSRVPDTGSRTFSRSAVARAENRSLICDSASPCCGEKPSTRAASRTALRPRHVMCSHTIAACSRP